MFDLASTLSPTGVGAPPEGEPWIAWRTYGATKKASPFGRGAEERGGEGLLREIYRNKTKQIPTNYHKISKGEQTVRARFNPIRTRGVIISAAVAVALCVWSSAFSLAGTTDPLRVAASTLSTPLTSLLDRMGSGVARGVAATFGRDVQYNEWMAQKAELEATLAEQRQQLAELEQLRAQNEQLRAYLSLTDHATSLVLTEARVLYAADTTSRLVTLDRGSRHGVEVGMPVLSPDGLIGRVHEVLPLSCKVTTLHHEKLAVGVRNTRSGVSGTLTADSDGLCRITDMDANIDRATALSEGDVIVTSGYGGNFPSDIPVGVIVDYGFDPLDRTPYALVAPYADASDTAGLYMIVTDILVEEIEPEDPPEVPPVQGEDEDVTDPTEPSTGDPPAPEQPSAGDTDPIDPIDPSESVGEEVAP